MVLIQFSFFFFAISIPFCVQFGTYRLHQMDSRLGQIKDPIQRAGVRLLWAAAIPIQTQARRFLARQAAIRRMCAVLTIQAVSPKIRPEYL
jgi:hypothetical protein